MLQKLHDYTITPAGLLQVWPTEGAEPYRFPIYAMLAWASLRTMRKYGAHEADDYDKGEVITVYSGPEGNDEVVTRHFLEWWEDVQLKDALLLDYLNAEITGRWA